MSGVISAACKAIKAEIERLEEIALEEEHSKLAEMVFAISAAVKTIEEKNNDDTQ